eukprot:3867124-Pyramimonas_sp.AAC.1
MFPKKVGSSTPGYSQIFDIATNPPPVAANSYKSLPVDSFIPSHSHVSIGGGEEEARVEEQRPRPRGGGRIALRVVARAGLRADGRVYHDPHRRGDWIHRRAHPQRPRRQPRAHAGVRRRLAHGRLRRGQRLRPDPRRARRVRP